MTQLTIFAGAMLLTYEFDFQNTIVLHVKQEIERGFGLAVDRQTLRYVDTDAEVRMEALNSCLLSAYFEDDDDDTEDEEEPSLFLEVEVNEDPIHVNLVKKEANGQVWQGLVDCLEADTIGVLKQKIRARASWIPPEVTLKLTVSDPGRVLRIDENDHVRLSGYLVGNGSTIVMDFIYPPGGGSGYRLP